VVGDGNPFEADRSDQFPLPPQKVPYSAALFMKAAKDIGFHPFLGPSANASQPYSNPYGCQMGPCNFCGFCGLCLLQLFKGLPQREHPAGVAPGSKLRTAGEQQRAAD
jgi:hypothetical protein